MEKIKYIRLNQNNINIVPSKIIIDDENLSKQDIEKLVIETKIGTCIKEINKVSGGLSHRMYKVVTDKGIYAIKELNSGVMKRKEAFSNFIFSEKVSEIAIQNGITGIGALKANNEVITKIDDNYYMIFEWLDARILNADEITEKHCEIIGKILAKIHNIDFTGIKDEKRKNKDLEYFEWNKYCNLAEKHNKVYTNLLKENIDLLYKLNEKSIKALEYANENLIISHTDLDRKNVMWQEYKPFIIDWGFWNAYNRRYTTEYFKSKNINIEWHYIDIDDLSWEENIKERNKKIDEGLNVTDFYVTDGLKKKLLENWEIPNKEEIDIRYSFVRNK